MVTWSHKCVDTGKEVIEFLNVECQTGPGAIVALNTRGSFDVWCVKNTKVLGREWRAHGRVDDGDTVTIILEQFDIGDVVVSSNSDKTWDVFYFVD